MERPAAPWGLLMDQVEFLFACSVVVWALILHGVCACMRSTPAALQCLPPMDHIVSDIPLPYHSLHVPPTARSTTWWNLFRVRRPAPVAAAFQSTVPDGDKTYKQCSRWWPGPGPCIALHVPPRPPPFGGLALAGHTCLGLDPNHCAGSADGPSQPKKRATSQPMDKKGNQFVTLASTPASLAALKGMIADIKAGRCSCGCPPPCGRGRGWGQCARRVGGAAAPFKCSRLSSLSNHFAEPALKYPTSILRSRVTHTHTTLWYS